MNQFESGDFVNGVDVLRANVRCRVTRPAEEVDGEIDEQIDLPLLDLRGVLALGLAYQRIVVKEAALGGGEEPGTCGDEAAEHEPEHAAEWCGHDQNAELAANTICKPSEPFAKSMRSGVTVGV